MIERRGVIFLDSDEIIVNIYDFNNEGKWELLYTQCYDLTPLSGKKFVTSGDFVEIIAEEALAKNTDHISEWRICARNIPEIITRDICLATGLPTEVLTLQREQELLCKGVAMEIE